MIEHFKLNNEDGPLIFSRKHAHLEPLDDKGTYILLEEFWVSWKHEGTVYRILIPKGRQTDIASVPRIAWTISGLVPDGLYRNAALIHDEGYRFQGVFPEGRFQMMSEGQWIDLMGKSNRWTRNNLDRLFLRIMKACSVDKATRTKMYYAVRLFGWVAW